MVSHLHILHSFADIVYECWTALCILLHEAFYWSKLLWMPNQFASVEMWPLDQCVQPTSSIRYMGNLPIRSAIVDQPAITCFTVHFLHTTQTWHVQHIHSGGSHWQELIYHMYLFSTSPRYKLALVQVIHFGNFAHLAQKQHPQVTFWHYHLSMDIQSDRLPCAYSYTQLLMTI